MDWMDFYHRCRNVARTLPPFRHPPDLLALASYRWHRRYNPYNLTTLEARSPPPSSPPPAHLVSPPGRSRPGFAPPLSPLGQGQAWRPAAPVHIQISTSMGGPHPDPDETPGDGWANPRARAWRARAAPCAPAPMPCRAQTELDVRSLPGVVFKRWTPCRTACPFPFASRKSTAARSSPPSSSRPTSNRACTYGDIHL